MAKQQTTEKKNNQTNKREKANTLRGVGWSKVFFFFEGEGE